MNEQVIREHQKAPITGCHCTVCDFFNRRNEAERRLDADLEANYQRYLAGDLVSSAGKE